MYLLDKEVHNAVVDEIGKAIDSKGKPGFVKNLFWTNACQP